MAHFLYEFFHWLAPWQRPLCLSVAWLLTITLGLSLWQLAIDIWQRSQTMHRIPCHQCRFFTNDHRLKCPIHPLTANSEQAINCRDYAPPPLSSH